MVKPPRDCYEPKEVTDHEVGLYLGFLWWKNVRPHEACDLAYSVKEARYHLNEWRNRALKAEAREELLAKNLVDIQLDNMAMKKEIKKLEVLLEGL